MCMLRTRCLSVRGVVRLRKGGIRNTMHRGKERETFGQMHFNPSHAHICSSWYSGLNKQHRKNFRFVKIKLCGSLKNLGPRSHTGFPELNNLNLLNVGFRVKQIHLSHVHKIFNGTGPSYLSEHFINASDVHHHFTRGTRVIQEVMRTHL